jgi:TnpA family transposase
MLPLRFVCLTSGAKELLPVKCDSKHFGAWEQNLMTQYHLRYGGRGVMIYWHVEKNSTCIYSQLKTCSSSEVSAMINGVLKHCTSMEVKKNYREVEWS